MDVNDVRFFLVRKGAQLVVSLPVQMVLQSKKRGALCFNRTMLAW